jgi:murein DD-endopeptidase MepM/ murein hydrolase activator NlpD
MVHLDADPIRILEQDRVVAGGELRTVLGRMYDPGLELVDQELVDGVDILAAAGAPVAAAAVGRVTYAGWLAGGWGKLVVVAHVDGVRTMYAHLSSIAVRLGQRVGTGDRLGAVGATGEATGPHLHFEVRLGGAAVDPRPALP